MIRDSADTLKRVSMELGGNAPLVVFDDAQLDAALDLAVATKYANAGQVCVTPDRFYVQEGIYRRFVAGFNERAKALRLGHVWTKRLRWDHSSTSGDAMLSNPSSPMRNRWRPC